MVDEPSGDPGPARDPIRIDPARPIGRDGSSRPDTPLYWGYDAPGLFKWIHEQLDLDLTGTSVIDDRLVLLDYRVS